MNTNTHSRNNALRRARASSTLRNVALAAAVIGGLAFTASSAWANGYGESRSWQFDTTADKANKALLEDLILRKKGGYYDAFKNTYNSYNTTNIDHQVNCNVSATSAGNTGNNGMDGSASSPVVTNDGTNTATANGNQSSNGFDADGPSGVVLAPDGNPYPVGSLDSNQDNSGAQTAGVDGSSNAITSGAINSGGGQNSQVLNSDQSNNGSAQTATVTGSTACSLASTGGALN